MSQKLTLEEIAQKTEHGTKMYTIFQQGTKYIYPQKHSDWLKYCHGKDCDYLSNLVEIFKSLKCDKNFYTALCKFKNFDDIQLNNAFNATAKYAMNGPEFYEFSKIDLKDDDKKLLAKLKQTNQKYEQELSTMAHNF